MNKTEFEKVARMIEANYSFVKFDETKRKMWYEVLKKYDFELMHSAIMDYCRGSAKEPTLADVIEYTEARLNRKAATRRQTAMRRRSDGTVACVNCQDYGFVTEIYPTGVEACRPCDCKMGHQMFGNDAFNFRMSDQDAEDYYGVDNVKDLKEQYIITEERTLTNACRVFVKIKLNRRK